MELGGHAVCSKIQSVEKDISRHVPFRFVAAFEGFTFTTERGTIGGGNQDQTLLLLDNPECIEVKCPLPRSFMYLLKCSGFCRDIVQISRRWTYRVEALYCTNKLTHTRRYLVQGGEHCFIALFDGVVGHTQRREQGDELPIEVARQLTRVLNHLRLVVLGSGWRGEWTG